VCDVLEALRACSMNADCSFAGHNLGALCDVQEHDTFGLASPAFLAFPCIVHCTVTVTGRFVVRLTYTIEQIITYNSIVNAVHVFLTAKLLQLTASLCLCIVHSSFRV
jgi:hypothetical protein